MDKHIGEVKHYFNKAGVMVIDLKGDLSVGDTIKIKRGEDEFEQEVISMQIDHEDVQSASKGREVAIKAKEKTREGHQVYRTEA